MSEKSIVSEYYIHLHVIISCTNTYAHVITSKHMGVCVCVCVHYGRSPEVIRPPAKCYKYCFSGRRQLWATERVPSEVAAIMLAQD